ncbi:DUF6000 family protein [Microbispora sp. H10830]|uniref:DUF6000 family protein n=1 Tax=Microbispora sp. H10830 TaxID=2729109 RepID=UPI0037C5288B
MSDEDLCELLRRDWRPRLTAAWLIGLDRRVRFRQAIGELLLSSEVCYAGQGYCFALANFGQSLWAPDQPSRNRVELRICVIQPVFLTDQRQLDRNAEPLPRFDQVLAAAGMPGSRLPGVRRRPGGDQLGLGTRERCDLIDPGELARRQPRQHGDGRTVGETPGLGPVLLCGQRVQIRQRMRDHHRRHALGPVQPRQRVGVLDQAGRAAQRPPQLVHHAQPGAARRQAEPAQRGAGVDHGERVRPGGQHRGGKQLVAGRADPGDVDGDRRRGQVQRAGGRPVEHPGQRPGAQQVEGEQELPRPFPVGPVGVGPGGRAQRFGSFLDDRQDVGHRRLTQ